MFHNHPCTASTTAPFGGLSRAVGRLLIIVLALLLPLSGAQAADSSSPAQRLTELLEPLKTYSADFQQKVVSQADQGGSMQNASGHMWLSRPGRFRWEVSEPYSQTVVSDGEKIYLHDPDLQQVSIRPLDQRVTHTPALLLSGQADELTDSYSVTRRQQGTTEIFTLSPKTNETLFESLDMTFRSEQLTGLDLTDSTGQQTRISFSNIRVNPQIDEARFRFRIPEGADVIRDRQSP
ncbi:outer membrane lipoprotein carrier protein [Kushneria sinocarnis]|uniref:Outer-membrane lipoprotein carrier protein n=1 Tax=Kushneria sinocarnis TaxID=595502 RepID=A0A420WTC3_9GAMM|nr:outer membrane lipoprotein chaperone LolA [Kushneria sinocarnis]RKQ96342.1 outer membrane lipoprotein carrier protein [Kushneria sinocarnis]